MSECPKSYITAESMSLLDAYSAWRLTGGRFDEAPAKQVDAFVVLERELQREAGNVRQ